MFSHSEISFFYLELATWPLTKVPKLWYTKCLGFNVEFNNNIGSLGFSIVNAGVINKNHLLDSRVSIENSKQKIGISIT